MNLIYFKISSIILIFLIGIIASYSDLKYKKVSNKIILIGLLCSFMLKIIYALYYDLSEIPLYFIELIAITILCFILYYFNVWAAGDSKLLLIILMFLITDNFIYKTIFTVMLIFVFGFIYIILESFYLYVIEKHSNKSSYLNNFSGSIIDAILKILFNFSMIICVDKVMISIFGNKVTTSLLLINIVVAITIGQWYLKKREILFFIFINLLIISLITFLNQSAFNVNIIVNLMIVILIAILRKFSSRYNHRIINIDDVEIGMVLSYITIIQFSYFKLRGLPLLTYENTKSRLNQDEVKSIKLLKQSKYNIDEIIIVRLIPFAHFIALSGLICSFLK